FGGSVVRHSGLLTLEPGEAAFDVGGVIDLPLLAVVDDVETGGDLRAYDVIHGRAYARVERRGVARAAGVLITQQRHQVVGPRQAPDVRRENRHRSSSSLARRRTSASSPSASVVTPMSSVDTAATVGSISVRITSHICLGSVAAWVPLTKMATTTSSNEVMKASR